MTPTRPLAHVLQALDELGVKAALAAAAGRPWSAERILERVPAFVRGVRPRAEAMPPRMPCAEEGLMPPLRERARGVVVGGLALLAALGQNPP